MNNSLNKNLLWIVFSVMVAVVIANLPHPGNLGQGAMNYMGIFVAMLIVLISGAMPDWGACLAALACMVAFDVGSVATIYSAFAGSIVWLMIAVFALAVAIGNSGLMNRLALYLLTLFPKNYNGQVLSLMCAGLVISPMIPSTNAKVNMLIPMATAMTEEVGYKEKSKGALGLFTACFMPPYIGSHAFLTGGVNVAYMLGIMKLNFTWFGWLAATWVWLLFILLGTYIYCMTYCKPQEKLNVPEGYFKKRLQDIGPMSGKEKITALVILICLVLWITQSSHGIDAGMIALLGALALSLFGLLTPTDFNSRIPWTLIMFIGALVGGAGLMTTTGVSAWLSSVLAPYLSPLVSSVWVFVPALCVITWVLRSFILAQGVCLIILFTIFGPLMPAAGISVFILVFVEYLVGNIWFNKFQNPFVMATLGVAGNKYVTFNEFRKSAYAYMAISLVACMASIPLWKMLGFC